MNSFRGEAAEYYLIFLYTSYDHQVMLICRLVWKEGLIRYSFYFLSLLQFIILVVKTTETHLLLPTKYESLLGGGIFYFDRGSWQIFINSERTSYESAYY